MYLTGVFLLCGESGSCTFTHPPERQANGGIDQTTKFSPYKPQEKDKLVNREFVREGEAMETVLPGGGDGSTTATSGEAASKGDAASTIKVEGA